MATNFPTSIDALVNPIATDSLATVNHADQHTNANDAIEALEAKVGVNGSAVTSSLDYRVRNIDASSAIVSGSTSGDLVRITQTGSGNALVVEDSANPDSTPFVVNASGYVGIGTATPYSPASYGALTIDGSSGSIISGRVAGTETFRIQSTATNTTVNNITALPILFSTNNTERMRIDSVGNVGIGGVPPAYAKINVGGTLPSSSNLTQVFRSSGVIPSTTTSIAWGYLSGLSTQAASFTLANLLHFDVEPGAFGAGSTVTAQKGFNVSSNLTGATFNYGFFGDIASGTNRYNLFMNGNAANFLAGRLGVGAILTSGATTQITNPNASPADKVLVVRGAASQSGNYFEIQNSAGVAQFKVLPSGITHTKESIEVGALGTGNRFAGIDLIGDDTYIDYGLRLLRANGGANTNSQINHRGTGDFFIATLEAAPLVFRTSDAERMRIDPLGNVSIGTATAANYSVLLSKNITGAANSWGVVSQGTIQSDVTGQATGFTSASNTAATAFTLSNLVHFSAQGVATPGAGSTITNQIGYFVSASLTGATSNYGFSGNIANGTNRYNLYMGGTAQNYLAGNTGIGVTVPTSKLHVVGSFSRGAPVTKTASFTLTDTQNWVICNGTATITVTLPAASTQVGREITIKNIAAFTVVSATTNIAPLAGGALTTAILPATAGAWAKLVSDGANWQIMQS